MLEGIFVLSTLEWPLKTGFPVLTVLPEPSLLACQSMEVEEGSEQISDLSSYWILQHWLFYEALGFMQ